MRNTSWTQMFSKGGVVNTYSVVNNFVTQNPVLLPPAWRDPHRPQPPRPLPGLRVREGGAGGQAGAAQPRHEGGHQDQDILSGEHRH